MDHQLYRRATGEYDVTFYFVFEWQREADWNFTDYRIPVTTFWYIIEGSRLLIASGEQHELKPGMLVALPTNTNISTTYGRQDKAPIHYLSMGIQAIAGGLDWTERYGIPIAMQAFPRHEPRELTRIWHKLKEEAPMFRQILSEGAETFVSAAHAGFALAWESKLKMWLSLMTQAMLPYMTTPNPVIDRRVSDICTYIRRNYARKLQADELARQAALSEGHMRAVFRQVMGMSPHQYILQTRIEKAKELLAASGLSLASIAELTGFEDLSHFVQMFRKREGVTPAAYRKRLGAWEG
ncbi:AraC family transcriptional regulator [Paenibacillus sp. GD4]|uniref:helix-turn-helix domain-containing protein n=1 Tax=Paenibacillus sp. GD4 TaxID=3068890 RepID=UPI002796853C|nr:AraC family transcriptional regulator [Paenibacillus sp. GD4]MDQ1913464.1 AraC family transcriptional regulator [Paenibacillus sp. GD4]